MTGTRLGLGLGQRSPRKSRQIATLRPPPQQNPERRQRLSRESLFRRARRAHLPRRSDARCPAGKPQSRPATSDWRAQPRRCPRAAGQWHRQELNAWEAPIRSPQLFNTQHSGSCRECHSGKCGFTVFSCVIFRTVYNDTTISIYFVDATLASALIARWCFGSRIESPGVFQVRGDEPAPRVWAELHRTP